MLRLKKKDKSPAKDRDRLRKRREGKRRQTTVLAVLRADFTFKFAAAVLACVGKTARSQVKFSFKI